MDVRTVCVDSDNMPPEFSALAQWLSSLGFDRTEHGYDRSFGDRVIEFTRTAPAVRLLRDRGEWAVVIGGRSVDGWYDVGIWRAYLRGTTASASGPVPTPSEQTQFVRRYLTEIERAVETDPALVAKLAALGTQRSNEMFGLS